MVKLQSELHVIVIRLAQLILIKHLYPSDTPPNQHIKISHRFIFPRQGTRKAIWPIVSPSFFDGLSQYPISLDSGYWGKLSKEYNSIGVFPELCDTHKKKAKKFKKSLHFGRVWYLCRGPPDCRCFHPFEQRQFRRKLCLIHIAITH